MSTATTLPTGDDAQSDALRRCGIDKTIHRVAYYAMSESGDFRLIFTYTNPHPVSADSKPKKAASQPSRRKRKALKAKKPKTLIEKITAALRRD